MAALPVAGLTSNFSPIRRIEPPPFGNEINGGEVDRSCVLAELALPAGLCACFDWPFRLMFLELRESVKQNVDVARLLKLREGEVDEGQVRDYYPSRDIHPGH